MKPCLIGTVREDATCNPGFTAGIPQLFQLDTSKVEKEIDMEAVKHHGLGFVRRPTGGRGVPHEHELTYSVIVPEAHPEMPSTVTEAYRVISEGILKGFHALGMEAYFAVPKTAEERDSLKNPRSAVCFDAPSWYELVVEGRKVAGSAQTRQKV